MVDLGGYVIILVETKDKKIKLYGSPAEKADLEVGDEILEVNGEVMDDKTHADVISHIHQCIRTRTVSLRVKRRAGNKLALDLAANSNVQDAFVIAVEQQARERLERLSALKRIKPVDMTKLSQQLNREDTSAETVKNVNGFIESSPIYVTTYSTDLSGYINTTSQALAPALCKSSATPSGSGSKSISNGYAVQQQNSSDETEIELKQNIPINELPSANENDDRPPLNVCDTSRTSDYSSSVCDSGKTVSGAPQTRDSNFSSSAPSAVSVSDQRISYERTSVSDHLRTPERRASSPFVNGRTEVLIGQDANEKIRTTAIVENHRSNLAVNDSPNSRPRRRSGSSIVVVDTEPVKLPVLPGDDGDAFEDNMMIVMPSFDGPHREMAVDVPDSFIGRGKTPPRYPPPRIQTRTQNGSAKPIPPPRDHLKLEDGRLINRAPVPPAPQIPARVPSSTINNNVVVDPTKEQLDSIRKFEEALRKRKEEEERIAAQNAFRHSTLRDSRKLQALESEPPITGVVNDGYVEDETAKPFTETSHEPEDEEPYHDTLHKVIGYGELIASLQRLQHNLKKNYKLGHSYSSIDAQVAAVQSLLLSAEFGRVLAIHNKVQQVWSPLRKETIQPFSSHSLTLVRECLESLEHSSEPEASELADLLTRYEVEGLLYAHDTIARDMTVDNIVPPPQKLCAGVTTSHTPSIRDAESNGNIKIIKIEKTNEPLGATVRNEGEAVIIGRVVRGGAAEKSGLLHEGDEVLEVNGIEMRGKSVNEVCDILSGMSGTLTFLIVPGMIRASHHALSPFCDSIMHVKAHFDYDPEDDMYIPCRELGISFQKGDVLHVICQDDPNWWQAYREGEEDQTLAGLIPSRSFQHQREALKQTISGDKLSKDKSCKKTGTFLCAKKHQKKKKKKLYSSSEGGYPLYSTSIDDFNVEEILTYEEVALYFPKSDHKRPIVLIGPPNIGRHELRQRLMEDSERFAAAIPHTSRARKDGEIDGQDYHFITRAQFEADILSRKFVEHGEYEKAYYGTSIDAIRSVVNSGKICVLNLHPQSLKILRSSDLKPYVVFVAPPPLEKLRQKKIKSNENYKEEELKDIIEKAREMEVKYGNFFDMIILNSDTERAYNQLLAEINNLQREPQWVPASWVRAA